MPLLLGFAQGLTVLLITFAVGGLIMSIYAPMALGLLALSCAGYFAIGWVRDEE